MLAAAGVVLVLLILGRGAPQDASAERTACDVLADAASTLTTIEQSGVDQPEAVAALVAELRALDEAPSVYDQNALTALETYATVVDASALSAAGDSVAVAQQERACVVE